MIRRLLAAAALALLASAPAAAQVDSGFHVLVQFSRTAAEVYVEEGQDSCVYIEHWFLFEDYVYPSERSGASFTLEPASDRYGSLERFLEANFAAHPRGTHVEVTSVEHREGCK